MYIKSNSNYSKPDRFLKPVRGRIPKKRSLSILAVAKSIWNEIRAAKSIWNENQAAKSIWNVNQAAK